LDIKSYNTKSINSKENNEKTNSKNSLYSIEDTKKQIDEVMNKSKYKLINNGNSIFLDNDIFIFI